MQLQDGDNVISGLANTKMRRRAGKTFCWKVPNTASTASGCCHGEQSVIDLSLVSWLSRDANTKDVNVNYCTTTLIRQALKRS